MERGVLEGDYVEAGDEADVTDVGGEGGEAVMKGGGSYEEVGVGNGEALGLRLGVYLGCDPGDR